MKPGLFFYYTKAKPISLDQLADPSGWATTILPLWLVEIAMDDGWWMMLCWWMDAWSWWWAWGISPMGVAEPHAWRTRWWCWRDTLKKKRAYMKNLLVVLAGYLKKKTPSKNCLQRDPSRKKVCKTTPLCHFASVGLWSMDCPFFFFLWYVFSIKTNLKIIMNKTKQNLSQLHI